MIDKVILSKNVELSTDCEETQRNNNVCVIGCTGSGKSLSVIEPRLLKTYNTNLIVFDPKRELVSRYRELFKERGYSINELNLSNPNESDVSFDPLQYVSSEADVNILAQSIINLTPQTEWSTADRYWTDCAAALAKFGIYYILSVKKESEQNFACFLDLINEMTIGDTGGLIKISLDGAVEVVKQQNPQHPMLEPYNSFKVLPIKTAGCVFSTLRTTLSTVFNGEVKKMFREKVNFNIEEFIRRKSILFITADGVDTYLNAFVNLIFEVIINQLFKCAERYPDKKLPLPVHLIMDDFACGAKMSSFPAQISRFRSKGISSTIVLQSESQLKAIYKDYGASTIISNCDQLIYLGGNDLETAENFAKRLDTPVKNVLSMPLGQVAIFRRGEEPIVDERYPIFEDKDFQKLMRGKKSFLKLGVR